MNTTFFLSADNHLLNEGCRYPVWAPHAVTVSVIGEGHGGRGPAPL